MSPAIFRVLLAVTIFWLFLIAGVTVQAQPGYSSLKSVHFEAKYQKGVTEQEVQKTLQYLEVEYEYLVKTLGLELKKPLEVRMYGAVGPFLEQSKQSKPWRLAIYQRNVLHLQPVKELAKQQLSEKNLSFELALAVLEQVRMHGCPRWICEAFAVYHSGLITELEMPIGMKTSAFADLDQQLQQFTIPPKRDDVLYILGQTMLYFVENFGDEKTMRFYKEFDGSKSTETLFRLHFGQDMKEIEKNWSAEMNSRLKPFKQKE